MIQVMIFDIEFNRKVEASKDYISFGGFEFIFGDTPVQFDFLDYLGYIEGKSVHVCLSNADVDSFPDMARSDINWEDVSSIKSFFVYMEEAKDITPILNPVKITELMLINVSSGEEKEISLSEEILKKVDFSE